MEISIKDRIMDIELSYETTENTRKETKMVPTVASFMIGLWRVMKPSNNPSPYVKLYSSRVLEQSTQFENFIVMAKILS